MENEAPQPTGRAAEEVTLTGKLIPWEISSDGPVLLRMPGSDQVYMPVFEDLGLLHDTMKRLRSEEFYKIKKIDDGDMFLESILENESGVVIILDPAFLPNGRIRFMQIETQNPF